MEYIDTKTIAEFGYGFIIGVCLTTLFVMSIVFLYFDSGSGSSPSAAPPQQPVNDNISTPPQPVDIGHSGYGCNII